MNTRQKKFNKGFTLVEMMVVAPIVIIFIGGFISAIVSLTGEAMASRGANLLTYNVQEALNRIEEDVKLSNTYLAANSVNISTTKQGYGGSVSAGSTVNFSNIDNTPSGGSPASLIINSLATNKNPMSDTARSIYLKDQPNPCTTEAEYIKNRPLVYNIVYFVDSNNTLWRRTVMPSDYADAAKRCGTRAPWQVPSCIKGYTAALSFCKTTDEHLLDGVLPTDFKVNYYQSASNSTPSSAAINPSLSTASRNAALLATPTVDVTITSRQTVAGRDINYTGNLRATRLDINASEVAIITPPTTAPAAPSVTSRITDGSNVTFTWPQVSGATRYTIDYRIKKGTTWGGWVAGPTTLGNSSRTYKVTTGNHKDTVEVRTRSANDIGISGYSYYSTTIPLWSPIGLENSWVDYSGSSTSGYSTAGFTKTSSGIVMLKGLIQTNTAAPTEQLIGTLPPEYRPTGRLVFPSLASGNASARIDVLADGSILYYSGVSPGWISLETVRFLPSAGGFARTAPSLINSWSNFGAPYATASYAKDSIGRVVIQGLIKGGSTSANSVIFNLPSTHTPAFSHNMATRGPAFLGLGVTAAPAVVTKLPTSNSYLSLNTIFVPSSMTASWSSLSLQNGWVSYGSAYATPSYSKTSDGVVQLRGLMKSGTITQSTWTTIATLPAGFRPASRMIFTGYGADAQTRVDITASGLVQMQGSTLNGWQSIDGIMFVAEQ